MRIHGKAIAVVLVVTLLAAGLPVPSSAAGIVGDGTPGSCTDAAFAAALMGGGLVTFNCGAAPLTIPITTKVISSGETTVIDGGGKITLDGGGTLQHFLVLSGGNLTLQNITLTNGSFSNGGAIYNQGTLTLNNVQITFSRADTGDGGGIYNSGTLTVQSSRLENNQASMLGGAIFNSGTTTVTDSSIIVNRAFNGAGLYQNGGNTTLLRSLLMGNDATSGGGVFNASGTLNLTNVTFAGNYATQAGGIYNAGTVTLLNVTMHINHGDVGGAVWRAGGIIHAKNTIFSMSLDRAGLSSSLNCDGPSPITSDGNNISSDNSCSLTQASDQSATDPMLGPLQDNGGPTLTHMPLAGSPAIDKGSACPATDQRGVPRPIGSACDIGAVEYGIHVYLPYITRQ